MQPLWFRKPDMRREFATGLIFTAMTACVVPRPAVSLHEREESAYVAVLSGEMPPPIDYVARHSWIVAHVPGEANRRFEYGASGGDDPVSDFTGGDVMLHGVITGSVDETRAKIQCLESASRTARERHPDYFPIPGPNSNTYVDILLRECKIPIELPATAIGRDYRGIVGASVTESRTGVQFESVLFGVRLGLVDGVEFHFLSFVFGLHFWPPGITVPVNPGRIGFASDEHVHRAHEIDKHREDERTPERKYGLGVAQLSANVARPITPSLANDLEGLGTFGFSGRALYGKTLGYGVGLDFAFGAGVPASFVYSAHLYPAGLGAMFGPTGYFGVFAGIGSSGVTSLVDGALEFPIEARLEMDATRYARIGFRARAQWNALQPSRERSRLANPAFDEITFGAFARFGRTHKYESDGWLGSGYFIGVERREVMGTAWLGLSIGVETDAAW